MTGDETGRHMPEGDNGVMENGAADAEQRATLNEGLAVFDRALRAQLEPLNQSLEHMRTATRSNTSAIEGIADVVNVLDGRITAAVEDIERVRIGVDATKPMLTSVRAQLRELDGHVSRLSSDLDLMSIDRETITEQLNALRNALHQRFDDLDHFDTEPILTELTTLAATVEAHDDRLTTLTNGIGVIGAGIADLHNTNATEKQVAELGDRVDSVSVGIHEDLDRNRNALQARVDAQWDQNAALSEQLSALSTLVAAAEGPVVLRHDLRRLVEEMKTLVPGRDLKTGPRPERPDRPGPAGSPHSGPPKR